MACRRYVKTLKPCKFDPITREDMYDEGGVVTVIAAISPACKAAGYPSRQDEGAAAIPPAAHVATARA